MIIWIVPAVILVLLVTERVLFRRCWDRELGAVLSFDVQPAVEGGTSSLTEVITNGKAIPVPVLEVGFALDTGLRLRDAGNQTVSDQTNAVDVFSVRGHEKITRKLTVVCRRRGYYVINRTSLVAHDFLSREAGYCNLEQNTHLYVYPGEFPPEGLELPLEKIMGEISTRRFLYEDIFLRRGVRDYVPTDPQSRVNWKASARTGSLKVNLSDHSAGQSVRILLNLDEPTIWYPEAVLEDSIRLAASLARVLIQRQISVSILTNGEGMVRETGSTQEIPDSAGTFRAAQSGLGEAGRLSQDRTLPGKMDGAAAAAVGMALGEGVSAGHLARVNELLARIDLRLKRPAFSTFLREETERAAGEGGQSGVTRVLISSSRREDVSEAAAGLSAVRGGLLWLCPLAKDMKDEPVPENVDFVRLDCRG